MFNLSLFQARRQGEFLSLEKTHEQPTQTRTDANKHTRTYHESKQLHAHKQTHK